MRGAHRLLAAALGTGVASAIAVLSLAAQAHADDLLRPKSRLRLGIGDRIAIARDGKKIPIDLVARDLGFRPELVQFWLTRHWKEEWAPREKLAALAARGVTPVAVHYFFGDDLSRERFEAARDPWYTSLWRLSQQIRIDAPVLVILEPEWNQPAPKGETSLQSWEGFADDLRAAAELIRREAPNALVGTCVGDFAGPPRLERVLGPASQHLDFLAFQEMRAVTDPAAGTPGYLDLGRAASEYSEYLWRAFRKPVLLAYIAVSSDGGWEDEQAAALESLAARRQELLAAGMFGAIYFQLVDDPDHWGYFGAAERRFGLFDNRARSKRAWKAFRKLGS
jgi:hypothetical protein